MAMALEAIGAVLADYDKTRETIALAGGIEAILSAMRGHSRHSGVQEQGCWALLNLASNNGNLPQLEHPENDGV